jgi:molecular chaperone GrpE
MFATDRGRIFFCNIILEMNAQAPHLTHAQTFESIAMNHQAEPQPANENQQGESDLAKSTSVGELSVHEQLAQMKDQWIRAVAETENVRKRTERDRDEMSKYAVTSFARDMVSVLENLKRASESIPAEVRAQDEKLKTLAEGVDLTLQEMLSIFDRYHIKRIDPMGEKFDHHYHQAVVQIESPNVSPGTVVQVVQAGYVIHDRLLRPAMVAVSKQAEAAKHVDTTA